VKRRPIGDTGVELTALGFGGAPIGNLYAPVTDDDAAAAVRAAWDGGVRYFDTAPHYGLGLSELRLGRALRDRPRADYVLSTKVGRVLVDNPAPTGCDLAAGGFAVPDSLTRRRDYTRDGVRRSLDASLTRLGLDRVDIVYVHDPEDFMDVAVREAVPALVRLREEGVVGAIGAGMNFVAPLLRFVTETDVDVVMLAGRWTLADRTGAALLAECADHDVAVVAAAPFNSGLLAAPMPPDDAHFDYGPAPAEVLGFARDLAAACAAAGTTLPHAAVQFPLRHPAVAAVVAGARTAEQAAAAAARASVPVPDAAWLRLDALDATRPVRLG
jgi:D-threo-aldose 1-dehydrogenase